MFNVETFGFLTIGVSPFVQTNSQVTLDTGVPAGAEVGGDDAVDELGTLMGQTVTISTKVTEVLSPNLFTAFDEESMRGEEILIVTDLATPAVDGNVKVTGEVMTFDAAAIDVTYGATLEPDVVEAYTDKPYVAAQAIEPGD